MFLLEGITHGGLDTMYFPQPLIFPQHARKKYGRPSVRSDIMLMVLILS